MKKTNKAFTIVELVIVIAVIAILAAVLIPTFSNLIEKANESKDTSLVKNINTALVMEEVNQSKNNTMSDALEDALTHGYTIEKLTPTSNGDIVWDEVNNRFALMKNDTLFYGTEETKKLVEDNKLYKLWKITDDANEVESNAAKYSFYLKDGFSKDSINVETGIDTGNNENINISYTGKTNPRNVSFNTNGGTLTVNAELDTVNHYGNLTSANIIAVDTNASYHENGEVLGNINVTKGRIVLESGCNVGTVAVSENNDIVKVISKGGNAGTVVCKSGASNVEIDETIKKQELSADELTTMKKFEGGIGTEESPYLIATEEQFKSIRDLTDDKNTISSHSYKVINDLDLTKISLKYYEGEGESYLLNFKGTFDGDNHEIKIAPDTYFIQYNVGDMTIKNVNFIQTGQVLSMLIYCPNYHLQDKGIVKLENIIFKSEWKSNGESHGVMWGYGASQFCNSAKGEVYFINCVNEVDYKIQSNSKNDYAGIFIGNYPLATEEVQPTITFINCINKGTVTGGQVGFFFGNTISACSDVKVIGYEEMSNSNNQATLIIKGCRNDGIMIGTKKCEALISINETTSNQDVNQAVMNNAEMFIPGRMDITAVNDMSMYLSNGVLKVSPSLENGTITDYIVSYAVSTSYRNANNIVTGSKYFL